MTTSKILELWATNQKFRAINKSLEAMNEVHATLDNIFTDEVKNENSDFSVALEFTIDNLEDAMAARQKEIDNIITKARRKQ